LRLAEQFVGVGSEPDRARRRRDRRQPAAGSLRFNPDRDHQ